MAPTLLPKLRKPLWQLTHNSATHFFNLRLFCACHNPVFPCTSYTKCLRGIFLWCNTVPFQFSYCRLPCHPHHTHTHTILLIPTRRLCSLSIVCFVGAKEFRWYRFFKQPRVPTPRYSDTASRRLSHLLNPSLEVPALLRNHFSHWCPQLLTGSPFHYRYSNFNWILTKLLFLFS